MKITLTTCLKIALCTLGGAGTQPLTALEHPRIWVSPADKAAILKKITDEEWAASLFNQLRDRADMAVARHQADRDGFLKALPLDWAGGPDAHPSFRYITDDESDRFILMPYLQDAIDCGVVYYLTGEEKYARTAADIMAVTVSALSRMERTLNPVNGGLIYPQDHLKEARIFGAQIPVACDFIYPYVKGGGKVYDIVTGKEREFPFGDAQHTFRTYARMAIEIGHSGSNWSVLESPSLVGNALMLESRKEREACLAHYLTKNTPEQDSLAKVAESYAKPGDIWPESLQYSNHVAEFSIYLMAVLDRLDPGLNLAQTYPRIVSAAGRLNQIRFPNGDVPSFGDGTRRPQPNYLTYEIAYYLSSLHDDRASMERYGSLIKSGLASGAYDRSELPPQNTKANIYKAPLKLLWSQPGLMGRKTEYPKPRTAQLPFAGIYIQRNENTADPKKDGLMLFVGGAGYVHGHASGMNVEFYGEGEVLGMDGGVGKYKTEIHENYYRLFAAHNTVISNGASASDGGWVNLDIDTVDLQSMEPMPGEEAVSPYHSFSTTRFEDKYNLVAPAEHLRTLALVRTSPTTGYYVDVFRARSDHPGQYHDYIYRNMGESMDFLDTGEDFRLESTPGRFQESASLPWSQNRQFRHPGWHYLENVQTSQPTKDAVMARFRTHRMPYGPTAMDVHMNAGNSREYSKALSPPSRNAKPVYRSEQIPTMVIRQEGPAWDNPFAFVFEPYTIENEGPAIRAVDSLLENGVFKGLVVDSLISGERIRQYVLILDGIEGTYENPALDITFTGHFAIVTTRENGEPVSLYIGNGSFLQYGDMRVVADPASKAAFAYR